METNLFAETTFRNERKKFGIKLDDRRRHIYAVGKTGMGKTELLKNMAIQDIREGRGVGFVDPHGEAAEELLDFVPKERINDVCYFNPADLNFPISFNVMEKVDVEHRHLVASGLMGVFKKIWPDVWSARMEYILYNSILALLEYPGSTLLGVNRILADPDYRKKVIEKIRDPVVKSFWINEFARYTQRYEVEATAAIQNKIGQFISAPLIRNIVGQTTSSVDMRKVMDSGGILILNLSKGKIGEDASKLLGGLLITKLQLAAMGRVDVPESQRRDFFLYVDEFQNFATESFVNILSEARKYRLALILAHQYIAQMEETVRDAVFGNMGTLISFRVGAEDAEYLEKEFSPEFFCQDLVNLPKYQIYLKLMVDGVAGRPFSAETLLPFERPKESHRDKIIGSSRERYATGREIVEEKIARWTGDYVLQERPGTPEIELYDARCQKCGKWTKVPFKPAPGRPVYCKSCLKKNERKEPSSAKATASKEEEISTFSLEDLLVRRSTPFSGKTESKEKKPKKKKEVEKEELRKALRESLEEMDKDEEPKNTKRGKIEPGETIKF
ncbi:type IV secretion system DNA-binding domain-containing protein [Patescibacteria group bacterium]|nr:type IV secretion system DNA-binding domain-containing protein [Patescibacteria group bacterium]